MELPGHLMLLAESGTCMNKMEFISTHWIILDDTFGKGCASLQRAKARQSQGESSITSTVTKSLLLTHLSEVQGPPR